jgi:hypothetical protein
LVKLGLEREDWKIIKAAERIAYKYDIPMYFDDSYIAIEDDTVYGNFDF